MSIEVINVDDLLACHEDFVEATLKNCMITDTALLRIISRLCAVCIEFCDFMQVINVDDLLACHEDFVEATLKNCMITDTALLRIISRLCAVCIEFCDFMQSTAKTMEKSLDNTVSFSDSIAIMDKRFTIILMSMFDKINDNNASTSGADKLMNIVNRFHSNSYYSEQREKMYAGFLDTASESSISNSKSVPKPEQTVK
ncbi:gamma-tubulin complex component 2 homolog [Ctenocephalides felis]|uniref:gamma-tubulin complex component 2 homolog n=1 Tax=Ctenocephalides felis TaxID=7515 RepID=UPI000E6E15C4|nr:gamma-tubulin complex component 2 homolog [Ctenocephalides felis]